MELFRDVCLLSKSTCHEEKSSAEEQVPVQNKTLAVEDCKLLENKIVALYFAASWCPACLEFTPVLREVYAELSRRNAPFEIVAVPFDRTEESCDRFYLEEHENWLNIRFDDPAIGTLKDKYNITAIPKLVVLRPDGQVITLKGRKDVQDKGIVSFRSWLNASNLSCAFTF